MNLLLLGGNVDSAGFMSFDCAKAQRAGLRTSPLSTTIVDTATWLRARGNSGAWENVLDGATEGAILDGLRRPE